ncbi:MAG: hypothetical protein L0027_05060, partial [Candidatus Rokubacteria bacterium]|nr:hypothetical protein [Candidatus Rokubacteria bacterium]
RRSVWESTHHLIRAYLHEKAGDEATAVLLGKLAGDGDLARDLAYRLYALTEKKKRSQDGQMYNALVLGWPEIARLARAHSGESDHPFRGFRSPSVGGREAADERAAFTP